MGNQFPFRPMAQVTLVNMKRHINIGQVSCPCKMLGEKNEVVIRGKRVVHEKTHVSVYFHVIF